MSPLESYQQKLAQGLILANPTQLQVIENLDEIYYELIGEPPHSKTAKIIKIYRKYKSKRRPIKGLYLWGSVGIGKTFIMDLFYHCLPIKKKRFHFHSFMQWMHQELKISQGQKNPLQQIGKRIARETRILCFDEFFVSNIADAMLMGELFKTLLNEGICLIASSNIHPDDLYKNGIQRELFLPTISLIKQNTQIIHMQADQDYRLRYFSKDQIYYTPLDEMAEKQMEASFRYFSENKIISNKPIQILNRPIRIIKESEQTIWFDFKDICGRPRSQNDYLEIVKNYRTVLISNVPIIESEKHDLITSFVHLIDVFYDARIRVVISAATPIEQIYPNGRMKFEYQRTLSRLKEMQTEAYWV